MAKKGTGNRRPLVRRPRAPQTFLLRTVVQRDEDVFHAFCPALPGYFSWGRTAAEALDNLREVALRLPSGRRLTCGAWDWPTRNQ
jgi:hypothetical protein